MREEQAECYLYYPSIVAHAVWRRSRLSSAVSEAAAARRRKAKCLLRAKGRKGKRRGYARGVCEIAARYVCAGTRLASKSNVTSVSRTSFHAAPCRAHKRSVSLSLSLSHLLLATKNAPLYTRIAGDIYVPVFQRTILKFVCTLL